jgi:hypothetical protein
MARAARKQTEIPGTEPERNEPLEDAVFIYEGFKQDRKEFQE